MIDNEQRIKNLKLEKVRLWSKATGANEHRIRGLIGCLMDTITILKSDKSDAQKDYYFRNCTLCINEMTLELGGLTRHEAKAMAPKFEENRERRKGIGL